MILHGANYDEAYAEARRRCDADGSTFIHPFDDADVIAGQGTIGLELLEQVDGLEAVVVPIGGGGLIGGIGCAVKSLKPSGARGRCADGAAAKHAGGARGGAIP